ncbi:MAG: acyltransferase, partial [Muribaculaceae bacterium]|nr:acyltransferase [Muribaculaceae bacterium]
SGYIGLGIRYICVKNLVKSCGENVAIFPNCVIKHMDKLTLGDNVSIHSFCYIDAVGGIKIGSNVSIAHSCSLISFSHGYEDLMLPIKYNPLLMTPICISDDVWIGCGVRIIGPCEINNRVIIAAGAVVKGNIYAGGIYGGVPAKLIKKIEVPTME